MIDKISFSLKLLGLEFKSYNMIKTQAIKILFKMFSRLQVTFFDFTSYKNNGNILCEL